MDSRMLRVGNKFPMEGDSLVVAMVDFHPFLSITHVNFNLRLLDDRFLISGPSFGFL